MFIFRSENDSHGSKMADENEKRKSEFSSLDTKQKSDAQVMMMSIIVIMMRMTIIDNDHDENNKCSG